MLDQHTPFTQVDPTTHLRRFMVIVLETAPDYGCHQINDAGELCLDEDKVGYCCVCGTPTCYRHASKAQCVIHGAESTSRNEGSGAACLMCVTCADLPREVQDKLYAFQRSLNGLGGY